MKYYNKLTEDIKITYGDRKKKGLLSLLYDVKKKGFIPVPPNKEHIDLVAELLKIKKDKIKENPDLASHFIPVNIFFKDEKVVEILIGISGIEMGHKVRHSREDLVEAHNASWYFVKNGDFDVSGEIRRVLKTNYIK